MDKRPATENRQASRMTHQRRVVLEHVKSSTNHPTAEQVYLAVRRRCRHVSLATVYRNLEVLSEQGLIQKLEFAEGPRRFDGGPPDHYHVRCLKCGRVCDVSVEMSEDFEEKCKCSGGCQILDYRLEFIGLCPACAARQRRGPGVGRTSASAGAAQARK